MFPLGSGTASTWRRAWPGGARPPDLPVSRRPAVSRPCRGAAHRARAAWRASGAGEAARDGGAPAAPLPRRAGRGPGGHAGRLRASRVQLPRGRRADLLLPGVRARGGGGWTGAPASTSDARRGRSERGVAVKRETPAAELHRLRREKAAADRRLARLRAMARLSGLIASSLDLDEVLREIARAAAQLMEAPAVGVWVADEKAGTLEVRAFSDDRLGATYPRRSIGLDEGLPGWVATHRQPRDRRGRLRGRAGPRARLVPAARAPERVHRADRAPGRAARRPRAERPRGLRARRRGPGAARELRRPGGAGDPQRAALRGRARRPGFPPLDRRALARGHRHHRRARPRHVLQPPRRGAPGLPVRRGGGAAGRRVPARRAGRGPDPDATPPRGRAHPGARDGDPGAGRALGRVPLLARPAPRRGRHDDRHARHPGGHLGAEAPRGPAPAGAEDGGRRPPGRRDRPRLQQPPRGDHGPQRPDQERAPERRRAGPRRGADPARVRARRVADAPAPGLQPPAVPPAPGDRREHAGRQPGHHAAPAHRGGHPAGAPAGPRGRAACRRTRGSSSRSS